MLNNLIRFIQINIIYILLSFIGVGSALAENLLEIYLLAVDNDPVVLGARQTYLADNEQLIISRAKILPNISFSGVQNYGKETDRLNFLKNTPYNSKNYALSINQPIFQIVDWMNYAATQKQTLAALKKYEDTEQNLILRVAQQYFVVLAAIDQLETSKSARQAFAKRLEQASQQFKVGVAAVTDINDAQARLDNSRAKEIADANSLKTAKEQLSQIVGRYIDNINLLKPQIPLVAPEPAQIDPWIDKARQNNIKLQAAKLDLEVARQHVKVSASEHLPTVSVAGVISRAKYPPTALNTPQEKMFRKQLDINLAVPIFSGGSTVASTQAAIFKTNAALQQLESTYREVESNTRIAYNSILTQISQVEAFKQSVKSSKVALKATQAAFEVGTRTIVDVLNAQSDVLNIERDYAKARYDYIINVLKLKQATGSLSVADLEQVNTLLENVENAKDTKEQSNNQNIQAPTTAE